MGKQIAKLGIRPEDLKDKTVTSEQLEKTKGGKPPGLKSVYATAVAIPMTPLSV